MKATFTNRVQCPLHYRLAMQLVTHAGTMDPCLSGDQGIIEAEPRQSQTLFKTETRWNTEEICLEACVNLTQLLEDYIAHWYSDWATSTSSDPVNTGQQT